MRALIILRTKSPQNLNVGYKLPPVIKVVNLGSLHVTHSLNFDSQSHSQRIVIVTLKC